MKYLFWLLLVIPELCGTADGAFAQGLYDRTIKPADAMPEKYVPLLTGKRVALVINQTSVVDGVSLLDILRGNGVKVVRILVPEHGFRGKEDAGAHIDNSVDSATGIAVVSLYGSHKKPLPEDLKDVDVVVYDLQDVGVRFYTYIGTLEYVMEACAEQHKQLMILDRPNPNGWYVDGPVLEVENKSFVGMQPIPVVYGMTAGEYAKMIEGERRSVEREAPAPQYATPPSSSEYPTGTSAAHGVRLDLMVIKCANYSHKKKYELPVSPSPNLRTMAAVYAYPSLCLFEGTPVSVGRGTGLPFGQYGCPEFAGKMEYSFTPQGGEGAKHPPYDGKVCYGEVVAKDETQVLHTINNRFYLGWLLKAYKAYPDKDKFFTPFFVKLCGTTKLQQQIKNGMSEKEIKASWQADIKAFMKVRAKYLLYE